MLDSRADRFGRPASSDLKSPQRPRSTASIELGRLGFFCRVAERVARRGDFKPHITGSIAHGQ